MSDSYYSTRLRWHGGVGGRGCAMLHGYRVILTTAPDLGAGPVHEVDYTPEVGCREIRRRHYDQMGDMDMQEVHAADQLLRGLCGLQQQTAPAADRSD